MKTLEKTIADTQFQAAQNDANFQLYLRASYDEHKLAVVSTESVMVTLHHAYLAGIAFAQTPSQKTTNKTPRILRTKY